MAIHTIDDKTRQMVSDDSAIFNYMTADTFFNHVFEFRKFRFSNLELTNDPYEYTTLSSYSAPHPETRPLSSSERFFCDKTVQEISRLRQRMCIGCFCYNEDKSLGYFNQETGEVYNAQAGYEHSRMWSQYGGDHRGVCLVFDKDMLLDEIRKKLINKLVFHKKISYRQNQIYFPDFEELEQFIHLRPIDAAIQYFLVEKNQIDLLFTKDVDYEREKEYRIAFYSDQDYEYVSLQSLRTIIIGHRFPKHLECSICEVGNSLGISILKNNYLGNTPYLTNFRC